jgi:putative copper export protein
MLILMALIAAPQAWRALTYKADSPEAQTYYRVSTKAKIEYGLIYLGLAAFLAVMTHDVHVLLESSRGPR